MAQLTEYALMAGASYISTRPQVNQFPVPEGWAQTRHANHQDGSGFEAVSFTKGTEIVISYAGTDPGDLGGDIAADLALAAGIISDQLRLAADYYLAVKANAPAGATITFTGHSLGGGLASLMAVLFGESAYTFDQAPFRQSAQIFVDTDVNGNQTSRSAAQNLRAYLTGRTADTSALAKLDAFIAANDPLGSNPNPADTLAVRGGRVSNINVDGEFLTSWFLVPSSSRIGWQSNIANSHDGVGGIDLHSQALLAAFLQSDQTAAVAGHMQSLSEVTFKLPELLKMIYDKNLFAYPADNSNTTNPNFLELIVNHEAGRNPRSGAAITPDAMVTRFTRDLWKIAQDNGLTLTDTFMAKALTAFAMQMYYEDTANATDSTKQLFTALEGGGGIRFDMADVSEKFKAAFDAGKALDLDDAKGAVHLRNYIETAFAEEERGLISTLLPALRDWYVQAGSDGMIATDTRNNGAFMLGGNGADTLTGGTADDLLVGNAGNDKLDGGKGNDIVLGCAGDDDLKGNDGVDLLIGGTGADTLDGGAGNDLLKGGAGNDTYAFTGSYGTDIVADSDGSGSIKVEGKTLAGATQTFESIYTDTASGQSVVRLNGGASLVVFQEGSADRILINDWSPAKGLGISLQDTAPTMPTVTLGGDFKKAIDDHGTPDTADDTYVFADGNYVSAGPEAGALDLISGTAGNDVIDGGGGDDALSGMAGDDRLEGGNGGDVIQGGLGKDTINGGTGDDILYGSSDEALVKPTKVDFEKPVNDSPRPSATGFNWVAGYDSGSYQNGVAQVSHNSPRNRLPDDQGNRIDGGAGNDFIAAGTGADTVHGGNDKDLIYGMDQGDVLFGDGDNDVIWGDGDMPGGDSVVWALPENHGNDIIDGGTGDDYLIGQGGSDIIFGGSGGDKLWGDDSEANLPVAWHGKDFLFGGAGKDELVGGAGDDYLEGGADDDTIWGGAGKDVYLFNAGDGIDTVVDSKADNNIIRFGAGVNKDDIKLRLGSLMLDLGNGDAVHIENFDQNDVFNSSSVTGFEFADGSTLSTAELLARGFDLDGSDDNDTISGTNTTDRIRGFAGDDILAGLAGNDVLDGGTGADAMDGGKGDDTSELIGCHASQTLHGSADGTARLYGGKHDDILTASGDTRLFGGRGNDTIHLGGDRNSVLYRRGDGQDNVTASLERKAA